jgi:hypothetical protein
MTKTSGIVALFVVLMLAIGANAYVTVDLFTRVDSDESHTRTVQVQGGPVAKCLLETLEAVEPLLLQVPTVEKPLGAYVRLQRVRYPGVSCPDR